MHVSSICLLLFSAAVVFYQIRQVSYYTNLTRAKPHRPVPHSMGRPVRPPAALHGRKNIWADLDQSETARLLAWLHSPGSGLSLTPSDQAGRFDNFILVTEIIRPNKTEAVEFLDHGANLPLRFARVTVKRNSINPPDIAEYMVGPLTENPDFVIEPLTFLYNSGRSSTINPSADVGALSNWTDRVAAEVSDIIEDLLGNPFRFSFSSQKAEFEAYSNDQVMMEDNRTMRWAGFFAISNASTLLPQGLYFKADTTGRDPNQWQVILWLYNNVTYESTEDFRRAWEAPDFQRILPNTDGSWTQLESQLSPFGDGLELGPPEVVQPAGSRVQIDRHESYVSWMGFTFNFAFSQVNGVSLYDIRLDGERIIYELSLQEAMAHYAGNDPMQGTTAFLDSLYGIGTQTGELLPGFDCPSYADFIDLSYHRMGKTYVRSGALCVFESPTDFPLQRHARGKSYISFINSVLIVRTITVVGNYDYLIDYIMYLDGTIEVKVRASGYIQGAFYLNNTGYGYHVHEALSSSIHDHVINFKADLDVTGGRNNSLAKVSVVPRDVDYPWSASGSWHTMALERSVMETETSIDWPPNSATMYVVVGDVNHLGERRGYRIMPGTGVGTPAHLTVQGSPVLLRSAEWAKHDLYVTRQKDTEPRLAVPANALDPGNPLVDFSRFLNNESIVDQDVVVWFNLGTHHIPHTGDIPNTLMTTSASSVMFAPHNYHTRDRSGALTNGVRVDVNDKGDYKATYYGTAHGGLGSFSPSPRPVRKMPVNDLEMAL